jgi:hypothetical protein
VRRSTARTRPCAPTAIPCVGPGTDLSLRWSNPQVFGWVIRPFSRSWPQARSRAPVVRFTVAVGAARRPIPRYGCRTVTEIAALFGTQSTPLEMTAAPSRTWMSFGPAGIGMLDSGAVPA